MGAEVPHGWLEDVIGRFQRPLLLYAGRIALDLDAARDAVQETFVKLSNARRADVEGHLAEWLYTVCRNAALDHRRKETAMRARERVATPAVVETAEMEGPDAAVESGEEGQRALALMLRLPAKQQEVLRLKFQGGLSYPEIARVTGDSVGNVGYLIHVGLKALRERMGIAAKGQVRS